MRDKLRFFHPRNALVLLALVLSACSGGGGGRSPDLPFPTLQSFTVACNPGGVLEVGQTSQCSVTSCTYREVLATGGTNIVTRTTGCPDPDWSSAAPGIATISDTGLVTAVAPGNTTISGSVEGVTTTAPISVASVIFDSAAVVCSPNPINLGQTSQCSINNCTGHVPGGPVGPRPCPAQVGWSASPSEVGTINSTGRFTSLDDGVATITAQVGTITPSPTTTITVNPACVQSIEILPSTATVIAGQTQAYTARAIFTNTSTGGSSNDDVTSTTTFSSDDSNVASFPAGAGNATATTNSQLATADSAVITGTYSGTNLCTAGSVTDNAVLNVVVPQLIANGLCLEPASGVAFEGCRADSGACPTGAQALTVGQQRQMRLRARFNNGLECNLTNSEGSTFTSSADTVASVTNTDPPGRGLVTGLSSGSADISASARIAGATVNATPVRFNVRLDEVLGANSVLVSAKPFALSPEPRKFACVGATDVVGGLADSTQLQGRLRVFAGARFCEEDDIDADGNCAQFNDDPALPPRDITNDDGANDVTPESNRIVWERANSYWDGAACVSTIPAEIPIGNGPPALVGDQQTPAPQYALGNRQPGQNGVVVGAGNLRIGFACITATYHNPLSNENTDMDGMTVLVLPVTNDVLLGSSTALDSTQLCDALEPLFQLGAAENGGNGAVTQLLSAVTEIVNPILQSLAAGGEPENAGPIPVDLLLTQVLTGVSDAATRQLFIAGLGDVVAALDQSVYNPLLCGVGALLNALTNPSPDAFEDAQACIPTAPTFPFPFPFPAAP